MKKLNKMHKSVTMAIHKSFPSRSSSSPAATLVALTLTTVWLALNVNVILSISSNARPNLPLAASNSQPTSSSSSSIITSINSPSVAQLNQQQAMPTSPSGSPLSSGPAAAAAALVAAGSAPASVSAQISNGAQLFQSPAALAALAAAAAAAAAASSGQQQQQQQMAALPAVLTARLDSAEQLVKHQQQHQQTLAANSLTAGPAPILASSSSASSLASSSPAAAATITATSPQQPYNMEQECSSSGGFISFELITGYVLGTQAESMVMQPGTLQLTDCLNLCRQNSSCLAINFETGLCVLLQESADKNPQNLQKSQFPVFTIYAHKICIQGDRSNRCHKSWSFERVIGWVLNNLEKKTLLTKTRLECLLACYNEQSFQCKSFNYDSASGSCQLSDMDRHSLPTASLRRRHYVESTIDTIDYGENNCIQEARGICDFKPLNNRILKTVDSIHQDIKTEPECRKRCLQAPYRCHSYDLGDSSNPVCRTSHLDRNSLQQIQDPYLDIQGAISYELDSCYNVTVVCKSREMIARVKTNKLFNGKIYAKNAPLSCMNDITNSMDFELTMAFNDACSISRSAANNGIFSNEIVLQHNDMIVTNSDMGLNIKCQYDLRNQTVYNNINLDDFMSGREPIDIASQSAVVRSPNITMQILRSDGNHITQAQVGDSLLLRFQITDDRSPFEIFVRDLYAMDGVGGTEIMLVDGEGCPTDPSIMAAMSNSKGNGQTLEAQFDAFKFPTSETVAFRALVTPCIPHCEPVHCQNRVFDGTLYEAEAYGKRRRRKRSAANNRVALEGASAKKMAPEEVVVRNSIEIKDKFFTNEEDGANSNDNNQEQTVLARQMGRNAYDLMMNNNNNNNKEDGSNDNNGMRLAGVTILFFGLLLAQSVLFVGWALMRS